MSRNQKTPHVDFPHHTINSVQHYQRPSVEKRHKKDRSAYHALLVDNNAGTLEAQFQNVCQQAVSHRDITDRPEAYPV